MRRFRSAYRLLGLLALLGLALWPGLAAPASAEDLPTDVFISGVSGHAQSHSLSCEARSAVDWAAFFGVDVSEGDLLDKLPRSDDPETGFVGSLDGAWGMIPPHSYGVHPPPVAAVLRAYGLAAQERQGMSWDDLRAELAGGRPVIVWIIGQMWNGLPIQYTAGDGQKTVVASFEHTMIAIGYSPTQIHVIDAYSGQAQTYPISAFQASWAVLGNRAIVSESAPKPAAQPSTGTGDTYTVQRGDYLMALAKAFDTTWQELAAQNSLGSSLRDLPRPGIEGARRAACSHRGGHVHSAAAARSADGHPHAGGSPGHLRRASRG